MTSNTRIYNPLASLFSKKAHIKQIMGNKIIRLSNISTSISEEQNHHSFITSNIHGFKKKQDYKFPSAIRVPDERGTDKNKKAVPSGNGPGLNYFFLTAAGRRFV
ncbi:MAG: hypothetical protein ACLT38_11690 [Akkermansia sp.]